MAKKRTPPRPPSEYVWLGLFLTAVSTIGIIGPPIFLALAGAGAPMLLYGIVAEAVRNGMFWADVDRATFDEQD